MNQSNKSIIKMIKILECFSIENFELSIAQLQKITRYPKSTIYRILLTLKDVGYIEQDEHSHKYSLGFNFFHLGSIVQQSFDIRNKANVFLKSLSSETKEAVHLYILDKNARICIDSFQSQEVVRSIVTVGEKNPLHIGASGKVILAHFTPDKLKEYMDHIDLTEDEILKLNTQFEEIRKKGYFLTHGERLPGIFALSAPVFDSSQKVVASMTVAVPLQRYSEEHSQYLSGKLLTSSTELSKRLGYQDPHSH